MTVCSFSIHMPFTVPTTTGITGDAEVDRKSVVVVNRCAIHHEGFLFDKGGESLVVRANRRCAAISHGVQRPKGARLSAGLALGDFIATP